MSSQERLWVENSTKFNKNDLKDASANNVNIKHTTPTTLIACDRKAITDSSNCIGKHWPLHNNAAGTRKARERGIAMGSGREKKQHSSQT